VVEFYEKYWKNLDDTHAPDGVYIHGITTYEDVIEKIMDRQIVDESENQALKPVKVSWSIFYLFLGTLYF
jgi:hypothetical protein